MNARQRRKDFRRRGLKRGFVGDTLSEPVVFGWAGLRFYREPRLYMSQRTIDLIEANLRKGKLVPV